MRVKVLGSAAGGGFPQWNCGCPNCVSLRAGRLHGAPRTQTQAAFSAGSNAWFLLNASPDLRAQILASPDLAPATGSRSSPIAGVFLTSADVDSVVGLLHLRESTPFSVFATPAVQRILKEENFMFRVLNRATPPVQWIDLSIAPQSLLPAGPMDPTTGRSADSSSFRYSAIPLGGDFPDYVSDSLSRQLSQEQAVVGILVEHGDKRMFFAPSIPPQTQEWKNLAASCDLVLLDGTFWSDDELLRLTPSAKTARAIGHLPLSGPDGLLQQCTANFRGRRVLIHINNTNPILDQDSAEFRMVGKMGWEVAHDGMEFVL